MKIKERWVAWEELLSGFTPAFNISFSQVGGMTVGSIPFADSSGYLDENNANLFWDEVNFRLGLGTSGPECRAHIRESACGDYAGLHPWTGLLIEGTTNIALQMQTATNGTAFICFASDTFNPPAGRIAYSHTDSEMNFVMGGDVLVFFGTTKARFCQNELELDSTGVASVISNSHNADAYFALEEDEALKWTMGFDYDDGQKFQISQGIPGTNVRFEIDAGTLINLYLDVGIRDSQDLRFYNNGNYVAFKPPALGGDTTWVLPAADGPANEAWGTDGAGNLIWRTHDELAGYEAGEHFTMLDEDNLVSDSDTQAATQQSIKAYVDALPGGTDEHVKIDIGAVAGYIGAAFNDGVLRTGASLSYADGGNFVTINTIQDIQTGASPTFAGVTLGNEGLHLLDLGGDHDLIIKPGTDLGADRILTITTGDAARTITLSGNPTLADWFDQAVKQASAPTFDDITVSNPVNIYALSHNAFADYAVAQHRVWEDSIAQDIHNDNISEGSVTQHVGAIDHDALLNTHANPYKLDDLAAPDDNTDLDFSTLLHGLVPKGTDAGNFLKDDGTWAVPAGGGDVTAAANLTDHAIVRGNGGAKGVQTSGVIIDDNDRVGIGTAAIPGQLTIVGGGDAWSDAGWGRAIEIPNASVIKWKLAGSYVWGIGQTSDSLYFIRTTLDDGAGVATYPMIIKDSGNVGIGTVSPSQLLEVGRTTAGDAYILVENKDATATSDSGIRLKTQNGSEFIMQLDRSLGTDGVLTFAGNVSNNLTIDHNTGNVGIGTASPGSYHPYGGNLVIYTADRTGMTIVSANDKSGYIFFADGTTAGAPDPSSMGSIVYSHEFNRMQLSTNDTLAMTIGSDQLVTFADKVAIPSNKLTIGSAVPTLSAYLDVRANNAGQYIASLENDHVDGWGLYIDMDSTSAGDPALKIRTPSLDLLKVECDGLVTIGGNVSMTSATSTITGGTYLAIEAGASGVRSVTIGADTTVVGADMNITDVNRQIKRSTSALKYKDKIKDLELDSSLIYNLRPVSFNSKCKGDDKNRRFIGLIADEIEQIYPEIINYNENNEPENYDHQMIMTLILAEVQRHEEKIKALEAQLNN